ncbi:lipopolysaccharide biosynthesis protein [Sediminibacterium soli]|uniref:lipopolysaccharide biosynthesis protein n=1 Tax=Sediminibacterium soli TaxID=2698829 RepID=UPI00137985BF|nr:polysaccharide biosynthesis C-terminal domain-containing protein [Sediminibacterium soli]NCI46263.1 oligosaccharide flippase family protein [Sediminibacterium soli]
MGSIRKQTIISSLLVYVGFFIGMINMYFYTKNGSFSPEQYALTKFFFDTSQIMFAFGSLGMMSVIFKFYPYYKDNLEDRNIDLMTWAMLLSLAGFVIILIAGWQLKPLFVRKFAERSPMAVNYYAWLFPFAMGMLFFSVTESFAWAVQKSIVSNFLKETALRILTTVIILLFYFKVISFSQFIYLFAFQYLVIFLVLFFYLRKTGRLRFTFRVSKVTKRYWKKMFNMQALIFSGTVIAAIASTIDSLIIASLKGLAATGIFVFAQYAANLIQVPQRSIQSVSASVLAKAWKDKNFKEIARIYQRSCINLLLLSLLIFGNLWLNISDAIAVLNIQEQYRDGMTVLFILGMVRIIDAGTGLNGMVISTSTLWRFDFLSGVILLTMRLPLTYYLIKNYGIIGSAIAELSAYSIYNFVRYEFLRRKFGMQPFTLKTLYSLLLALGAYLLSYFLFRHMSGWLPLFLRAGLFSGIMCAGIFYGKLTPDAGQMFEVFVRWWRRNKEK